MHTASAPVEREDTRAPEATPEPPKHGGSNYTNNRIPGDVVNKATAELPDHQRGAIRRFHGYYAEHNLSLEEAADKIRYAAPSLSMVFRGQYKGGLDNVVEAINTFFDWLEKTSSSKRLPFIKTDLSETMWNVFDQVREFQKMGFMFSDGQIGKSEISQEYQRTHNHGNTLYVEMPTGGSLSNFLTKLAKKLRVGTQVRQAELRQRIIDSLDERMLIIIDEIHRCTPESGFGRKAYGIATIDFIKEMFNEKRCGIVMIGTNVFRTYMANEAVSKFFEQINRRRLLTIQLPNQPTVKDLNTFAKAYDLKPAEGKALELQTKLIAEDALGMWLTLLRMAAKVAGVKKAKMDWSHVLAADAGVRKLEGRN